MRAGRRSYLRDEETGHFWSPTPLPVPRASAYVTRHGFGYSVFEHTEAGIRSELTRLRRAGRPGQVLGAEDCATIPAGRGGCPQPATWNGCWATCGRNRHACRHRGRSGERRAVRAQRLQHRVRRPGRLLRRGRCEPHRERRPHGISRPQRHAGEARGAWRDAAVRQGGSRRSIPVPRSRCRSSWPTGRSERSSSGSAPASERRGRRHAASSGSAAPAARAALWKRSGSTGNRPSAPCRSKRPTRRSMCWPMAGSSTRRWRAVSGRAADTTSRGAPSVFATSCRMPWR